MNINQYDISSALVQRDSHRVGGLKRGALPRKPATDPSPEKRASKPQLSGKKHVLDEARTPKRTAKESGTKVQKENQKKV